jgi:multidrug resistance protein, MATE family
MLSSSPLAEQALVDEIPACSEDNANGTGNGNTSDPDFPVHGHALYRRPSGTACGTSRPVFIQQPIYETILNPLERKLSREAEQSLLRDNHVLPPKHDGAKKSHSMAARLYRRLFSTKLPPRNIKDEPTPPVQSTERDPLLRGINSRANGADADSGSADDFLEEQWEEAVTSGHLRTTWQREAKTIMAYSAPLITTFFLQYSITVTSIFVVGRIGKIELGAVSRE